MPSKPRSRILCVDDDEDACEMLSVLMKTYEFDATCARSADDAWPLIKTGDFKLYVLDAWLPGLDGFEFCRQIRRFDSQTPIVFYSAAAYDADKQKGLDAGANAYVTKPDVEVLIKTLSHLVAKAKVDDVVERQVNSYQPPLQSSFPAQFFSVKTAGN